MTRSRADGKEPRRADERTAEATPTRAAQRRGKGGSRCAKSNTEGANPTWAKDCEDKEKSRSVASVTERKNIDSDRVEPRRGIKRSSYAKPCDVGKKSGDAKSETGRTDSICAVLCRESDASTATESITGRLKTLPMRPRPSSDMEAPQHAMPREESEDPQWARSKTEIAESKQRKL